MKLTIAKRAEIITQAVAWLEAGTLASALPGRLMDEYDLTPAQARELAQAALRQHKKSDDSH